LSLAFQSLISRRTLTPNVHVAGQPERELVRLIYFDAAGTTSEEPFCVVAAIIVHEDHWTWLDYYSRDALLPL
jgi:hypothetical protein